MTRALSVETWAPRLNVTVDGQEVGVAAEGAGLLTEVTVEQSIDDLDSFTLTLYNWDEERQVQRYRAESLSQILGGAPSPAYPFGLGRLVAITMGYPSWTRQLIEAEITRIRPVFPAGGPPTLVIEGSDGLHRLRGTRYKAYTNKTDSDIVQAVVDLANADMARARTGTRLRTEITRTTERYDHVYQHGQTDASFLKQRAARIGYEVFVREDTLYFRPPAEREAPRQLVLEWGKSLQRLDLNLNLGSQPSEVEVRSWDGGRGQLIQYKTTDADLQSLVGSGLSGPAARLQVFGGQPVVITDIPVRTREEARSLAVARLRSLMEEFVTVRGATFGMPDLKPGVPVTLTGIDPVFEGEYYLTECTHRFDATLGYTTEFAARRMAL